MESSQPFKQPLGKQHHQQQDIEEDKMSTSEESSINIEGSQSRQLTNLELIKKAEEAAESLELEKAVALYEEGVERFPNDTVLLDGYADLLI